MGTVRLGKRTDNRTPRIKDFVPLAPLECLSFGDWDIFEDNAYEAAANAKVLDAPLLEQLKEPLSAIKPMKAVFDHDYVRRINGPNVKAGQDQNGARRNADGRHPRVQGEERLQPAGDDLVRLHRSVSQSRRPCTRPWRLSRRACRRTIRRLRPARSTPTPR